MIKKAKEYLNELQPVDFNPNFLSHAIRRIVEQAQLDMLEYAVEKSAENAELLFHDGYWKINKSIKYFQSGIDNIQISEQSILKTIDEIRKELE